MSAAPSSGSASATPRIWIAVAYGRPFGARRGKGYSHTWAAWWKAEPTRAPWRSPDACSGGRDAADARAEAERFARAAGAEGDVVVLPAAWARAAQAERRGDPLWPAEDAAELERLWREQASEHEERDRAAVARFASSPVWRGHVFAARFGGSVDAFRITGTVRGRVKAARVSNTLAAGEEISLDPAELARDGRAWSRKLRAFVFAWPGEASTPDGREGPGSVAGAPSPLPNAPPERDSAPPSRRAPVAWSPPPQPRQPAAVPMLDPGNAAATDARQGTEATGAIRRWTPRHVWTLHRVPGRLDGPLLVVRRRVLADEDHSVEVEIARHRGAVWRDDLEEHGRARTYGGYLGEQGEGPGCHVSLWVYDHAPTPEEQVAWFAERLAEQAVIITPPTHVWIAIRSPTGGPDIAVPVMAARTLGLVCGAATRADLDLDLRALGSRKEFLHRVDVYALARGEVVTVRWSVAGQQCDGRVFLERPSAELLAELGSERAAREAEAARHRAEAEAFCSAFRTVPRHPGLDALERLGLAEGASAEDVRRAFRERAKAGHPDKGGAADMGELVSTRDAALAYVDLARTGGA